jgi:radical SAM superfamily enzyme YgiQ (UPF0313 family)
MNIYKKKKILLVEPSKSKKYHTPYPPLGLLKLAAYHKIKKDFVRLVSGFSENGFEPNIVYITSLFTYAYEPVHEVIHFYSNTYRKAKIIVGGIYASLCSEHLKEKFKNRIEIHHGLLNEVEDLLPDYSLVPDWNASILFSSRGCIRKCPFCSVPQIEPEFKAKKSIKHLIYPGHKKVILWDNNFLASPYWRNILNELEELNLEVDFNQGLDARLLNEEIALRIKKLKIPFLRLAYDSNDIRLSLNKAIQLLNNIGIKERKITVYCLFNHLDTPEDFLTRLRDLLDWGVVAYPMRYEPIEPRPKNTYISPNWTAEQLEMIAKARRVIGYGGAFPPYEGLKKKIFRAKSFEEAFKLRPIK